MQRVHIPLDHGTLLMMEGATQEDWQVRSLEKSYTNAVFFLTDLYLGSPRLMTAIGTRISLGKQGSC